MLPAPDHRIEPPFSRVRLVRDAKDGMGALSVTPAGMIVRPLPLMVPPVQFITVLIVTVLVPVNKPLLKFSVAGDTAPVPLKLAVPNETFSVLFVKVQFPVTLTVPLETVTTLFVQT